MKAIPTFMAAVTLPVAATQADVLFSDSFEYGDTTDNIQNVSPWSTGSGVLFYDAATNLTHPGQIQGGGGSFLQDFDGTGARSITRPLSIDMSDFSAGDTLWLSGLIQWNQNDGGGVTESSAIRLTGGSVTGLGFGIDSAGGVFVNASDDGGTSNDQATSATATFGSTHLFLLRATKGTGSSPEDSVVDFWFDPTNTGSVAGLGAPTFSTGPDSKFGRDSQSLDQISVAVTPNSRADEIVFGTELSEVVTPIPEPSTAALIGLAGLTLIRRRR